MMINIGLMKLVKGVLKPVKGKGMVIRVCANIHKLELLRKAVDKHSAYDRKFDPNDGYTIVYPDGSEILTLPGEPNQLLQLDKYKEDIGKPYNRISLYLVQRDYLVVEGEQESDSELVDEGHGTNGFTLTHEVLCQ